MFVFIAHAEADQAAADNLKAFLKSRGMVVETESGDRGFRHLQASDVVIALWSQKSVFARHRMQIERRMLEAWEGGRLVLVKLDHGFLPLGLRDLPSIDASFEANRQLAVWPAVERAAKEAMNRALVEKEAGPGRLNSTYGDMKKAMEGPTAVFISYAHADNDAVTPVVKAVEANGRPVWIDKTGIQTGDGWAGEIVRAIKGAKGMLVMCSARAFESDHIKREVYIADRYKKPMAPVFLEAAQPPEDFEYFFAAVQWLELYKVPEAERFAAIGRALASV
jgi:hypothetical protein